MVAMRRLFSLSLILPGLAALCGPLTALGEEDEVGRWYLNPYAGGITPDKPWGAKGGSVLYGLDVGMNFAPAWSAELDVNGAPLRDRFRPGDIWLYGGALDLLRVFRRDARLQPYASFGVGLTHVAPPSGIALESRTEFMAQPGGGAIIRLWTSGNGSHSLALRPDIKVRWTHGWAHAPGNPVDILYVLGLKFSFGPATAAAAQ